MSTFATVEAHHHASHRTLALPLAGAAAFAMDSVEMLILDEADRLFELGFIEQVCWTGGKKGGGGETSCGNEGVVGLVGHEVSPRAPCLQTRSRTHTHTHKTQTHTTRLTQSLPR